MLFTTLFWLSGLAASGQLTDKGTSPHHFKPGEYLEFKLSYGWFTVGRASVEISSRTYENSQCYQVDAKGRTSGLLGVFTYLNDHWGGLVDQQNLKPVYGYRNIEEGKYRQKEQSFFLLDSGKVKIERYDPRNAPGERKPPREYPIAPDEHFFDMVGTYLYMRNMDYGKYSRGDTITTRTFYEKDTYNLKFVYQGVEMLRSKVGDLYAHRIQIVLPKSGVFPDQQGIVGWVSADRNKLPLRVEAEMSFGKAACDLTSYRNIRYGPDYQ